ncbi:MAG: hypothetical protein AAGI91_17645 [Bacteroidota bacterium]
MSLVSRATRPASLIETRVDHRGDASASRAPGSLVTRFYGHVHPASMVDETDRLEPVPADPPALSGTGRDDLVATVGDVPATLGLASVEVEVWETGQGATSHSLAVADGTVETALDLDPAWFPSDATEYNVRARSVPAPLLDDDGGEIRTAEDLTSAWTEAITFTTPAP